MENCHLDCQEPNKLYECFQGIARGLIKMRKMERIALHENIDTGYARALVEERSPQYIVVQNIPENIVNSSGTAVILEVNENLT